MRKRIVLAVTLLLVCLALVSGPTAAAEQIAGAFGESLLWHMDLSAGTLTISGQGAMEQLSGRDAYPWSAYRESVRTLVIDEGVTSIADAAFSLFTELREVSLPTTLTSIGSEAFLRCAITTVQIPQGVTAIGSGAFRQTALREIAFPSGLRTTGDNVLFKCTELQKVTLPEGMQTLGNSAFEGCTALQSIAIPDSVTSIGLRCFFNCSALQSVDFGNGVTYLWTSAFEGCTALRSVLLPDSVSYIGSSAFSSCENLSYIRLGAGVQTLETPLFYGCNAESIVVSESNPYFCTVEQVLYTRDLTELVFVPTGFSGELILPKSVSVIRPNAALNCTGLTAVTVPGSVREIGYGAFYGCVGLKTVQLSEGIVSIAMDAFGICRELSELSFPASLQSIGRTAFSGCIGLRRIVFTGDQPEIEQDAFLNVQAQGEYPQENESWQTLAEPLCGGITWPQRPVPDPGGSCGDGVQWSFSEETGTLTIFGAGVMDDLFDDGAEAADVPWAAYREKIVTICVEEGVRGIAGNAFSGCGALTDVTLAASVETIGSGAFRDCTALERIVLPQALGVLEPELFCGCTALREVTFGDAVTTIGERAFGACTALCALQLPQTLINIETSAFYACTALEEVTIPASVTYIGTQAFAACTALHTVRFAGDAPQMTLPFEQVTAQAYYPAQSSQWTQEIRSDCGGSLTWVPYCTQAHTFGEWEQIRPSTTEQTGLEERTCLYCGHTQSRETEKLQPPPTEPPTDPVTEPPTAPATEPPTEPVTQPPTDPPTESPTVPSTVPPTAAPTSPTTGTVTELPTEPLPPPAQPSDERSGRAAWILMGIGLVLLLPTVCALLPRWLRRK